MGNEETDEESGQSCEFVDGEAMESEDEDVELMENRRIVDEALENAGLLAPPKKKKKEKKQTTSFKTVAYAHAGF